MGVYRLNKGLALPISGAPAQNIEDGSPLTKVAIMAGDYPYMKPRMHVAEGDVVQRGQLLFEDRKSEGVAFTAPAAGTVVAINRGKRRVLQSLIIELSESEKNGDVEDSEMASFASYTGAGIDSLNGDQAKALLTESGLWTAIRVRPHSRVPSPTETCTSIFVTAIDTQPLSADPAVVIAERTADFQAGLQVLATLTDGPVRLCKMEGADIPTVDNSQVEVEEFGGAHPAGLVGTHIHFLDPVNTGKTVWHVGYQDLLAIGTLFTTGKLDVQRVVAVAGPAVQSPKLMRTRLGANTVELTAGQLKDGEIRIVAGSVLGGRQAQDEISGYLGRYHLQVSCLHEERERVFLGWLAPGTKRYSTVRAFVSSLLGGPKGGYDFTTTTNGSHRAMVPIGMFEKVMPLDLMPTFLLRALLVDDVERAQELGCLELDEEDLALCSFVSPGKEDYGPVLRRNLTDIWLEG